MKLCIPIQEAKSLDSTIEPHFPHADYLIVFDTETRADSVIPVNEGCEQESTPIDVVLCNSINRMILRNLHDQGIAVYGTKATTVREAIDQFEHGKLESVGVEQRCEGQGHSQGKCCGGHNQESATGKHECCGGHGHDDTHECCGGRGHDQHQGGCGCHDN